MRHDATAIGTDGVHRTGSDIIRETADTLADSVRGLAEVLHGIADNLATIAKHPRASLAGTVDGLLDGFTEWSAEVLSEVSALMSDIVNTADDSADGFLSVNVCPDCMSVAANGAGETSAEHLARYNLAARRERETYGATTELVAECPDIFGDCRDNTGACMAYPFSRAACEWCGDTLAGHREHAAIRRGDWD